MRFFRHIVLTSLSASLLLANPYESKEEEIKSVIATGQKASSALLGELGGNLKKELEKGGALGAAKFCSHSAFELTQSVAAKQGQGVQIKRVSLKNRNAANAPLKDEAIVLESLEKLHVEGVMLPEYLVKQVDADTYKFYKPMLINKEVCLKCHGVVTDAALKAELHSTYPTDKAMGYKSGDLRGAVVVTIKK
ncbi:MAG: DUF3365 domain-containing protein [Campylobacterales bacterium]|nr:DUF3365 domain-containing protein [Campylobacterales bacterium]